MRIPGAIEKPPGTGADEVFRKTSGPGQGGRIAMENNRGVIHPASPGPVVLAAILFGILDHGGTAIDVSTHVPREIVLVQPARD